MDTLYIKHLKTRYRLPRSMVDQRQRLDQIMQLVFQDAIEHAMACLGILPHEELCIRKIFVPLRLQLSNSDHTLMTAWSMALAKSIQEMVLRHPTDQVVRYGSRIHGLIDLAMGVATGDLRRAWAWRQMGFIQQDGTDDLATHADALAQTLSAESSSIVPVMTAIAQQRLLDRLLERLSLDSWESLGRHAVIAAGLDARVVFRSTMPSVTTTDLDPLLDPVDHSFWQLERSSPLTIPFVRHILRSSHVAQAVMSKTIRETPLRWPLAAIAILEAGPTEARRGSEAFGQLVQETARQWTKNAEPLATATDRDEASDQSLQTESFDQIDLRDNRDQSSRLEDAVTDEHQSFESRFDLADTQKSQTSDNSDSSTSFDSSQVSRSGSPQSQCDDELPRVAQEPQLKTDSLIAAPVDGTDEREPQNLLEIRQRGETLMAGLLFLAKPLEEAGILDQMVSNQVVRHRPLRWALHQLAMAIVSIKPHDPAALAFAGLMPNDLPPSKDQPPPSSQETALLQTWVNELCVAVLPRLGWQQREASHELLLDQLCRRHGRIIADPGWFEVHLSLNEISTDIRRAGLDLDPGYVPWLGVVLKFFYD